MRLTPFAGTRSRPARETIEFGTGGKRVPADLSTPHFLPREVKHRVQNDMQGVQTNMQREKSEIQPAINKVQRLRNDGQHIHDNQYRPANHVEASTSDQPTAKSDKSRSEIEQDERLRTILQSQIKTLRKISESGGRGRSGRFAVPSHTALSFQGFAPGGSNTSHPALVSALNAAPLKISLTTLSRGQPPRTNHP